MRKVRNNSHLLSLASPRSPPQIPEGRSVSELQLAVSVRMAGALRKAGEVAAKLRRLSAAVLAVRLFSAPLGLLVLFGPRKERTPRYGSMFRIHAP